MTIAPERPLALPAPLAAAGPQLPTELAPVAASRLPVLPARPATPSLSPRPHYIAAAIATTVELADLTAWLLLRPISAGTAYALILIATLAASVLAGAACLINSSAPSRGETR